MMVMEKSLYDHFAGLLDYPHQDIKIRTGECIKALANYPKYPAEAMEELKSFQREIEDIPLDDIQGVYSYTFELTTDFTLDMGSHIYDGFKRSNQLATIKSMYKLSGFPYEDVSKGELPDHLPVVLRFLSFLQDEDLKKNFRETFLILAMEKLVKNFDKNRKNVYSHLITAIYKVIDKDVKGG